jgi:predicted small metal-binding protein
MMTRKIADCRRFDSDSHCTMTFIGEEDEVVEAAAQHAAAVHQHPDNQELREEIRDNLEPEESYVAGTRVHG